MDVAETDAETDADAKTDADAEIDTDAEAGAIIDKHKI